MGKDCDSVFDFKLLRERAMPEDAFAHKTHENAADTISEIISREDCGTTIGVEGPWGGGKSTVIQILKQKLRGVAHVFMFDAWAHEGDCLRQVFLSTLISDIRDSIGKGSLKPGAINLDSEAKKIDGREKNICTRTTRKPTKLGVISLFMIGLFSVGSTLLTIFSDFTEPTDAVLFRFGIVFFAAPVVAVISRLLYIRWKHKKWFKSFFFFFSTADITQEVTDDVERTSVEFSYFFKNILEDVTQANGDLKFVMVIDNLDRVPPKDALSLWSTMQTFLQFRSDAEKDGAEWFKKLWLVVPYDPDGVNRMWSDGQSCDNAKAKACSFIDKSFPVRVEIPRPVLSDWEEFAMKQMKGACATGSEQICETAMRIFKVTRKNPADIPTPRQIKIFVNQFCVLMSQYYHKGISAEVIAYYVTRRYVDIPRMSVDEVREALVSGGDKAFVPSKLTAYLPKGHEDQIAGLVFGVDPLTGRELLLQPEIVASIEGMDGGRFKKIFDTHSQGAWMILDSWLANGCSFSSNEGLRLFRKVMYCLGELGAIDASKKHGMIARSREFVKAIEKIEAESVAAQILLPSEVDEIKKTGMALKVLVGFLDAHDQGALYRRLATDFRARLMSTEGAGNENLGLAMSTAILSLPEDARTPVQFEELNEQRLLVFLTTLQCPYGAVSKWVLPNNEILQEASRSLQANKQVTGVRALIKYAATIHANYDWGPVVSAISNYINNSSNGFLNANIPSSEVLDALLYIIGCTSKYDESIANLLRNYRFWNFVGGAKDERCAKAALLLASVLPKEVQSIAVNPVGHSMAGIKASRSFLAIVNDESVCTALRLIYEFGIKHRLRGYWCSDGGKLYGALVEHVMQNDSDKWFVNSDDLLDDVWVYRRYLEVMKDGDYEVKIAKHLLYLDNNFDFRTQLKSHNFSEEELRCCMKDFVHIVNVLPEDADLLRKIEDAYRNESVCKVDDYVKFVSVEDFYDLMKCLKKADPAFCLLHPYYRALKRVFVKGESEDDAKVLSAMLETWDGNRLSVIVSVLDNSMRFSLCNDICQRFCSDDKMNRVKFYDIFGGLIGRLIPLANVHRWVWGDLDKEKLDDYAWIRPVMETLSGANLFIADDNEEIVVNIRKAIESRYKETTDESLKEKLNYYAGKYLVDVSQGAELFDKSHNM